MRLAAGHANEARRECRRAMSERISVSVHVEIEPDEAWDRVSGTGRPLARDPQAFRALYDERLPLVHLDRRYSPL